LPALTVEALGPYEGILVQIVVRKGPGHFERKFQWEWGCPPTAVGIRKLESLAYHVTLFA